MEEGCRTVAIRVPDLGLAEGERMTVSCWLVSTGDDVIAGDRVVELAIGEMTFDVPCPANGRLARRLFLADDSVEVGSVLGLILADPDDE